MPRPNDCIYCPSRAGSREHIFPATLGGRRKNKGILCASCNGGFSELDGHLAGQLQVLRGLLGVRPDRRDAPLPAAVPHDGKSLLIDGAGRPSFKDPITLVDEPGENGERHVQIAFSSERQLQEWCEDQKRRGRTLKGRRTTHIGRVMEPVEIELALGGPETFREVARIAINFLAHRFPVVARAPGLRPLKEYVLGSLTPQPGQARPVWFLGEGIEVPAGSPAFGHQVFIRLDRELGTGYAVVRFFDAVAFVVDLGRIAPTETGAVLFDIDPHAEHEPHDLFVRGLPPDAFPATVALPRFGDELQARMGDTARLVDLFERIGDRQSRERARLLAAALERVPARGRNGMRKAVAEALREHEGTIYHLIRAVSSGFSRQFAAQPDMAAHAACLAALVETDVTDPTGLTMGARVAVQLARTVLADAIASELERGPIAPERLLALLEGGEGGALVARLLLDQIEEAMDRAPAIATEDALP